MGFKKAVEQLGWHTLFLAVGSSGLAGFFDWLLRGSWSMSIILAVYSFMVVSSLAFFVGWVLASRRQSEELRVQRFTEMADSIKALLDSMITDALSPLVEAARCEGFNRRLKPFKIDTPPVEQCGTTTWQDFLARLYECAMDGDIQAARQLCATNPW